MNQPTNHPDTTNQDRIIKAADTLESAAIAEGDGREFHNPERRFICRYFLTHADDPAIQRMWDEYDHTINN